jgi:hypothetical protein
VGTIPDDHFDVDENPDNRDKDKEVGKLIDALIIAHRFAKNYGPHRIIPELWCQNIPDCKIPAQKQLENRLYYFWKQKFGYHNEIGPLEEKLRKFVFSSDEADEQAFIGPQGTSICSLGPRVSRIPYKSVHFFWDFLFVVNKLLVKNILRSFFTTQVF